MFFFIGYFFFRLIFIWFIFVFDFCFGSSGFVFDVFVGGCFGDYVFEEF